MEREELEGIEKYARRMLDSQGCLSALSSSERQHLKLLIQKYELEQRLGEIEADLAKTKLL